MSDTKSEKKPEAGEKKSGGGVGIVGIVLPALLAGAAAFGGAKMASAHAGAPGGHAAPAAAQPPGTTLTLEPFLLSVPDATATRHAMRMTVAIEFDHGTTEDTARTFVPRIRDAVLSYLRGTTVEAAMDAQQSEAMRTELRNRIRTVGATTAEHVLITDLVVQ